MTKLNGKSVRGIWVGVTDNHEHILADIEREQVYYCNSVKKLHDINKTLQNNIINQEDVDDTNYNDVYYSNQKKLYRIRRE